MPNHAFAVASATPARWIGIFSPARYMQLIEDLGAIMPADGPPDVAKVLEVFAAYDTELVTAAPAP